MGFSRKRLGCEGKPRYTAYYVDVKGRERSAGTFSTKKEADKGWQRAEAKLAEGRVGDPARGRMTFERYVEDSWLPNHEIELTTRQSYTYSLYKHIMPEFGSMRMIDILPEHVREWITKLRNNGVKPVTIKYNKIVLSAIFRRYCCFRGWGFMIRPSRRSSSVTCGNGAMLHLGWSVVGSGVLRVVEGRPLACP